MGLAAAAWAAGPRPPGLGRGVARAMTPSPTPPRLVVVFTPNGTIPEEFFPGSTAADAPLGPIAEPLSRHRANLLMCDGLDMGVTEIAPGNPHQKGMMALLTGHPANPGEFCGGANCFSGPSGWASAQSIDQRIAQRLRGVTPLPSLELGVGLEGDNNRHRLAFAGSDAPMVPIDDPRAAFDRVFADADPSSLWSPERLRAELSALEQRAGGGAARRLRAHIDAVAQLDERLGHDQVNTRLPRPGAGSHDYTDATALQLDLVAAALSVDATRVATVVLSGATAKHRVPWVEPGTDPLAPFATEMAKGFHEYTHEPYQDPDEPAQAEVRHKLVGIYRWYAEQVASLADRLAATEQADGSSLLDDTMILWCTELATPDTHLLTRMPFVVVGGRNHLVTGQTVDFRGEQHSALLATLVAAMGEQDPLIGHPDFARGPVHALLRSQ